MIYRWPLLLVIALACVAAQVTPVSAQDDRAVVTLKAPPDQVGLLGALRPGSWTAMKLSISNTLREARTVKCEWIIPDADGDPVHYARVVTLTPGRSQFVWLYGAIPSNAGAASSWRARAVDMETGEVLATTAVTPSQVLAVGSAMSQGAVGIVGSGMLGLEPYVEHHTQQEPILLLRGLRAVDLPDRWHGLSFLDALIWTPALDPTDAGFSLTSQAALRQWVRRGGHLVICMSSTADGWYESSLSDMLPDVRITRRTDVSPTSQHWLGLLGFDKPTLPMAMHTFVPRDPDVAVLMREQVATGEAVIVARTYGMGRVTVIGLDLSQKSLGQMGLPNGSHLWKAVFGWQSPAYPTRIIKAELNSNMIGLSDRGSYLLSTPLTNSLNPPGFGAGAALFTAILFFIAYWFIAAPLSFFVLRRYKREHLSWLVFILAATLFSGIAWGGAYLMRPADMHVRHNSVVDINLVDNLARVQSWTSIMIPRHGTAQLDFATAEDDISIAQGQVNTMRSALAASEVGTSDFLVPLPYIAESASPNSLELPVRSTIKPVELDYAADIDSFAESSGRDWQLLQTDVVLQADGELVGYLAHALREPLANVRVVICPGDGRTPVVRHLSDSWPSGKRLLLHAPSASVPLVGENHEQRPPLEGTGFLDALVNGRFNSLQTFDARYSQWTSNSYPSFSAHMDLLSFYAMLPPPPYRTKPGTYVPSQHLIRNIGRSIDISLHTPFSRLIIIGELSSTSLPTPLRIDEETIESSGTTLVRWIVPLRIAEPLPVSDDAKELP